MSMVYLLMSGAIWFRPIDSDVDLRQALLGCAGRESPDDRGFSCEVV
jgi:hypothetical protein